MNFVSDTSMVLYLPLYDMNGESFMSRDAYGHICTVNGAVWTPQGRLFDGVDDKIVVPHHNSLSFTGDFSIIAYIKPQKAEIETPIFKGPRNTGSGLDKNYILFWVSNYFQWRVCDGVDSDIVNSDSGLSLDAFYCMAMTRDSSYLSAYRDGVLRNQIATTVTPATDTSDLYIGDANYADYWLQGLVGEVRIYNRALTPSEIERHYLVTKWRYR